MLRLSVRILEVLAYFDLFNYPLSEQEIDGFIPVEFSKAKTGEAVMQLITDKMIFKVGSFYSLRNDFALAAGRMQSNAHARPLFEIASRTSRFLFHFPFVRAICISGSLSKNCADENGDIDYFIITCGKRLWLARTFMHLFKKITFLTGKQHWYCMNYYIDEWALQIMERNVYTAMEIVTLVPMEGTSAAGQFFRANNWTSGYFPRHFTLVENKACHSREWKGKIFLEKLFDNRFGDRLDDFLMNITRKRWIKKEMNGRVNMNGNRMGIEATKHFCKPNPRYLQQNILNRYYRRLDELKRDFHLDSDPTD